MSSAILIVPSWCRPGAAIDYLATDGEFYPAVIAYLTQVSVVIELADGNRHEFAPEEFTKGEVVRQSTAANRVMVSAFPQINVTIVGKA